MALQTNLLTEIFLFRGRYQNDQASLFLSSECTYKQSFYWLSVIDEKARMAQYFNSVAVIQLARVELPKWSSVLIASLRKKALSIIYTDKMRSVKVTTMAQ